MKLSLASALHSTSWLGQVTRILIIIGSFCWVVLSARLLAAFLFFAFLFALLIPPVRRHTAVPISLLVLALLSAWTPVDFSAEAADGPLRFVQRCPSSFGATHRESVGARAKTQRRDCIPGTIH